MTKTKAAGGCDKKYSCPNCGKALAMGEKCSCDNPVTITIMIGCRNNYLAYIDKNGNIRRLTDNER